MPSRPAPCCADKRLSRRQALQAGSIGLFGLGLPGLLAGRSIAEEVAAGRSSFGRAKACILLFMWGGPAHQDTWDLKTEAPADFRGAVPFPGPTARAEQKTLSEFPPHAYYVQPINAQWKFGLGIETPFGLTTEWNADTFPGRYISTKAALRAFDINPTIGWQVTPNFGVGFGAIARFSDVQLERRIPSVNPFTQRVQDIAAVKIDSDLDSGYGWNIGFLHRYNNSFSWGLSYRSKVTVDYSGDARLRQVSTGNQQFDAVVRPRLPFDTDLPVETSIEFPDVASLGLAFALSPNLLLETDVNWAGWKTFDETDIRFVSSDPTKRLPDSKIKSNWDDAMNYRAGLRWTVDPSLGREGGSMAVRGRF